MLRALAGSTWGCQKEIILMTYKALIWPIICYGCAVWYPMCAPGKIEELQRVQNSALRIATGCHLMSSTYHLHDECKILPVKDHLEMLCSQFLVSSLRASHPSFGVVRSLPERRSRTRPTGDFTPKQTLYSLFKDKVSQFLVNDEVPENTYKSALKTIHTDFVRNTMASFPPNSVLGIRPPPINDEEKELSRAARTTLSQLRSGFSIRLNSYRKAINLRQDDLCPGCLLNEHNSSHLFECSAYPTNLLVSDLWSKPREVMDHLVNLPSFDDLPPAIPPAPPPQPAPPP